VDEIDDTKGEKEASLRPIIIRAALLTIAMVVVIALAGAFFREPLQTLADWVVVELGLVGVFLGVIATDAFTVPVPPDTYLFVAVASQSDVVPILAVCCFASILAGQIAYKIGPYIQRLPFLHARLERYRTRGERLFRTYGVWTVALAALTPLPFSVTCWLAGIYRMPYRGFFLATFARIPRLLGYYGLFVLGWAPPVA
jgi:membrane protein YqaA with SNARE-associated domain